MTSRILISLNVLALLLCQRAAAQLAPAEDFFNSGAQLYISNNIPAALERVELGLKTYPNDEKLKKLEQLLKQQQQSQQNQQPQQNQSQSQQQPSKNDQQKQQNQQPQSQSQQRQEDQKQKEAAEKKDEQQKESDEKKSEAEKPKDEQKENAAAQPQPSKPGEMTPEEAKQLLDAQKGNEQLLPMKPDNKPRNPSRPVKDW